MIRITVKVVLMLLVLLLGVGYLALHRLRTGPEIQSETLAMDGLDKVRQGVTTVQEVMSACPLHEAM